jgi:hypothetical protein
MVWIYTTIMTNTIIDYRLMLGQPALNVASKNSTTQITIKSIVNQCEKAIQRAFCIKLHRDEQTVLLENATEVEVCILVGYIHSRV